MRSTSCGLASLILALAAGTARAEDWRAVSTSGHDIVFVDSDSVRRGSDGRIAFRARHRLAENGSNRDFGYTRIDLNVKSRCRGESADPPPTSSVRKYFLADRPVAAVGWRDEEVVEDAASLARTLCRGLIGYRRFADLDEAMAEYGRHDSLERLAAYVTAESELTGLVVQGFEMNAVGLCGADRCREAPIRETCWLEGGIDVPAPAGAPEWVDGGPRRDSAGAAFKGRVHRSRTGRGFGHMGAMGCLVEVTGPARFVEIVPPPRPRVEYGAAGARPEAVAASAAFAESIRAAAKVEFASDGKTWTVDDFGPAAGPPSGGACYSLARRAGDYVTTFPPVLAWTEIRQVGRTGKAVTLVSRIFDQDLDLHLAHDEAAGTIADFIRRASARPVMSVAQDGDKVTIAYGSGPKAHFRFADAAEAVRAAGIAGLLPGLEVEEVKPSGNRVAVRRLQRQVLTFPDEARAAEAERRMVALREACEPAAP